MTRPGGPPMRPDGPVEKPRSFGPSVKRLVRLLLGHRWSMLTILASTLVGVALTAVGPLILGHATNLVFDGVIGGMLPGGRWQLAPAPSSCRRNMMKTTAVTFNLHTQPRVQSEYVCSYRHRAPEWFGQCRVYARRCRGRQGP